jgi:Tol biopolymer transport system component
VVVGLAALAAVAGFKFTGAKTSTEGSAEAITIKPITAGGGGLTGPRLSPDAEAVAYAWTGPSDDNWDIYVKALGPGTKPLRLTEDPASDVAPAWSPDGKQIAFVRLTPKDAFAIYMIPAMGGTERKLIDVDGVRYGGGFFPRLSWSPDGRWLVYRRKPSNTEPSRIFKLSLATLESSPVTTPAPDIGGDKEPEVSPDGTMLAFVRESTNLGWGQQDIWVQPVAGGEPRRVTSGQYPMLTSPAWTADGSEIVFSMGYPGFAGQLIRVRTAGGAPVPVGGAGDGASHVSVRGTRAVFVQSRDPAVTTWRLENPLKSPKSAAPELLSRVFGVNGAFSPDGGRLAFQSGALSSTSNIWVAAADGGHPVQLTDLKQEAGTARWSPDGKRIAFDSTEKGNYDIWVVASDGGVRRQLTHDASDENASSWSADGQWIYFGSNRTGRSEIWKIPEGGGTEVQVTRNGGAHAIESTDGKRLCYSNRSVGAITCRGLPTGDEVELVHESVIWWNWALGGNGIYYRVDRPGLQMRRGGVEIFYQPFDGSRPVSLYRGPDDGYCLTVSPDERWLMFNQVSLWNAELRLIENFR